MSHKQRATVYDNATIDIVTLNALTNATTFTKICKY